MHLTTYHDNFISSALCVFQAVINRLLLLYLLAKNAFFSFFSKLHKLLFEIESAFDEVSNRVNIKILFDEVSKKSWFRY